MAKHSGKLGQTIKVTVEPPRPKSTTDERKKKYGPYPEDDDTRRPVAESTIRVADISSILLVENRVNNGDVPASELEQGRPVIGVRLPVGNLIGSDVRRGDTYGVSQAVLTDVNEANERLLWELTSNAVPNELWVGFFGVPDKVSYFTEDPPGFPEDDQPLDVPPYRYKYRDLLSRKSLPAGAAASGYGVSIVLKSGSTAVHSFQLGSTPNWKGRPDAQARFNALNSQTPPTDPEELADFNQRKLFAQFEAGEQYGYNSKYTSFDLAPPDDTYRLFTVGYGAFSNGFTADSDSNTFSIEAHGLATGDGPFTFSAGSGVLPGGIEAGVSYWAISVDEDTIKVATSKENAESDIEVNFTTPGTPAETRKINGLNHWKEGLLHLPRTPGGFTVAVETNSSYFEPWDATDTDNYKVTSEPLFSAGEVALPKLRIGASRQSAYVLLVPQWWRFQISFDAWVVYKWASPDHRIGIEKPVADVPAPTAVLAGLGPGNLSSGEYHYAVSWETADGVETRIGLPQSITVLAPGTNGQVRVSNIPVGPSGTIKRHIYRTPDDVPGTLRSQYKFLATIDNNDEDQEYIDNIADGDLGATAPTDFPFPFGNSKPGDWFLATEVVTYDPGIGAYDGGAGDMVAGFYHCILGTGETWDDWAFCSADAVTPPSSGCFDYDQIRYRQAQAERACLMEGFKKALPRLVFPRDGHEYATSAFTALFPTEAVEFQSGIPFSHDPFTEEEPELTADSHESILITNELDRVKAQRALCAWAENGAGYEDYWKPGNLGETPFGKYFVDIGLVASPDSTTLDGEIFDEITGVDASFDPENIGQLGSDDTLFVAPPTLGTEGPSHWWSKDGKLNVWEANTPAGSLVGAIQTGNQRFYIWRKTDSVGRDQIIAENIPYDSVKDRFDYSQLSGVTEPPIPRLRIRSGSDGPPEAGPFDHEF